MSTDAWIEKAAMAMHGDWKKDFPQSWTQWEELPDYDRECYLDNARVALTATLPGLLKPFAAVAAMMHEAVPDSAMCFHAGEAIVTLGDCRRAAEAIRSLGRHSL